MNQGFKPSILEAFIRKLANIYMILCKFYTSEIFVYAENEVGGEAFLLLKEEQIKQLIPAIGPQVKLLQKHKRLCDSLPDKQMVILPMLIKLYLSVVLENFGVKNISDRVVVSEN